MKIPTGYEQHRGDEPAADSPAGPFPAEPAFGSPGAVAQAAEWFYKKGEPGIKLPAVLQPNGAGGMFYVAQFNREEDALLCSAAREMADALEAARDTILALTEPMLEDGLTRPGWETLLKIRAALRKAGRLGGAA